jgi:hypothetical protein
MSSRAVKISRHSRIKLAQYCAQVHGAATAESQSGEQIQDMIVNKLSLMGQSPRTVIRAI